MKPILFFCSSLFFSISLSAQRLLPEFGKPDIAELQLKSCSFEPTADAMVLFDFCDIEINIVPTSFSTPGSSRFKTERRLRIKIFNEKGFRHAIVKIPYFSKKKIAKIKGMSAVIHNLDATGKIVTQKLDQDDFFKEKVKENLGMVTFTFPGLQAGSIIEFRYTRIENNILQLDPWLIQRDIPVAYSSIVMTSPTDALVKNYVFATDSIPRIDEYIKGDRYIRSTYFANNIPSFKDEPFMSSSKDHLMRVIFAVFPRGGFLTEMLTKPDVMWKIGGDMFKRTYKSEYNKIIPGTEKLIDSAKNLSSIQEKIGFLYSALKKRIPNKAEQTIRSEDIVEAWNSQVANSAEINLILINLLKKAGVECYPLLVSTRENGTINRDFPSAAQFNGLDVLAFDSSKYFLLDASIPYQSYLNPPLNILNRVAFMLSDSVQWVTVNDNRFLLAQHTSIFAAINPDGNLEGSAVTNFYDYAKSYRLDSTLQDDEKKEDADKKPIGLKIEKLTQENADNEGMPLMERIEFTYEPNHTGDFYFINPRFLATENKNPFTQASRNTDIDLGCNQQYTFSFHLAIAPDWEIESQPKNTVVRAPDSSFYFRRTVTADASAVTYGYIFEINRSIFGKEEYSGVQEFFKLAYSLMSEEIILKRKKKKIP